MKALMEAIARKGFHTTRHPRSQPLLYPMGHTMRLFQMPIGLNLKENSNGGEWWHSGKDCPQLPSGGRACPPSLFDCHRPWHWDLALAWVLAALAAQELSACQKFKFWGVLSRGPLTPSRPARCVSAVRVRDGQVLPSAAGAERCQCLRGCGHCGTVDETVAHVQDLKDLDKLGIDLETSLAAIALAPLPVDSPSKAGLRKKQ